MPQQYNMPRSTSAWAKWYVQQGWTPIPIPDGRKAPRLPGWQKTELSRALDHFDDHHGNLGLLLGQPSNDLVDIDLDCAEAVAAADILLPRTGAVHGRTSHPRSHRWYQSPGCQKTIKFEAPDGKSILEVRSTGGQTVAPPSSHPTGERIEWESFPPEPGRVAWQELLDAASEAAAAALIAREWPKKGSRQKAAMALSGGLLRRGVSERRAAELVRAVSEAALDDETQKRIGAVATTRRAIEAGHSTTGLQSLLE